MTQDYTNRDPTALLTDTPASWPGSTWTRCTTYVPPPTGAGRLQAVAWGWRLYRDRRRFTCAITVGAAQGVVFAALQALLPFRRIPHVMIDCLWYRERTPWRRALARLKFRLLARSVSAFVVWASVEVEDYAREFGLPQGKLVFLPFHHTLEGYDVTASDDGYVFAGGDGDRDYASLVAAARALAVPVLIATRLPQWHHPAEPLPPNVTVRAMSPEEFRQAMARARVVVVPMQPGLLHLGGQQTYLNAMALGKPVLVADDRGAPDYITDGLTGLLVPAGDAGALTRALSRLLYDATLRASLGRQAAAGIIARDLSTDACMRRIVALAEAVAGGRAPQAAAPSTEPSPFPGP